jgi:hypothetical protein
MILIVHGVGLLTAVLHTVPNDQVAHRQIATARVKALRASVLSCTPESQRIRAKGTPCSRLAAGEDVCAREDAKLPDANDGFTVVYLACPCPLLPALAVGAGAQRCARSRGNPGVDIKSSPTQIDGVALRRRRPTLSATPYSRA